MQEPRSQYDIRGEFISAYFDSDASKWKESCAIIAARDAKLRALNAEFGFRESGGTFPIGRRTHVDDAYTARYDAIEAEFKAQYDGLGAAFEAFQRSAKITIWEYLLLDNVTASELKEPFSAAIGRGEAYDLVNVRAREEVRKWAVGRPISDSARVIPMLLHLSSYALPRCRRFFGFSMLDLSAWRVMRAYRKAYKWALEDAMAKLVVDKR